MKKKHSDLLPYVNKNLLKLTRDLEKAQDKLKKKRWALQKKCKHEFAIERESKRPSYTILDWSPRPLRRCLNCDLEEMGFPDFTQFLKDSKVIKVFQELYFDEFQDIRRHV